MILLQTYQIVSGPAPTKQQIRRVSEVLTNKM